MDRADRNGYLILFAMLMALLAVGLLGEATPMRPSCEPLQPAPVELRFPDTAEVKARALPAPVTPAGVGTRAPEPVAPVPPLR